jgi:hypothetical protein
MFTWQWARSQSAELERAAAAVLSAIERTDRSFVFELRDA